VGPPGGSVHSGCPQGQSRQQETSKLDSAAQVTDSQSPPKIIQNLGRQPRVQRNLERRLAIGQRASTNGGNSHDVDPVSYLIAVISFGQLFSEGLDKFMRPHEGGWH
jgi:hypothetical protein